MKYEICYLVGESKDSELESIKQGVEEIVSKEGGVFEGIETRDKRKLAYKVKKEIRGTYVARRFEVVKNEEVEDQSAMAAIIQKLNLYPEILRFVIVKADELPVLVQREAPLPRQSNRRPERSRGGYSRPERKAPISEEPAEKKVTEEKAAPVAEKPVGNIDEKLDEILNI